VQQPCSNPSKSPEMLGKVSTRKHDNLQAFCTLLKRPAKYLAACARRRSGVRIPSAPLRKMAILQVKHERPVEASELARGFVLQPLLQRGFRDAVCTVMHSALLAREQQEKITAEQLAEALAVLCSRQPCWPSICPLGSWWLYRACWHC
jgi:hypothetical protein